jgi:RNA polymerase sigma-70 factor, ECF subfamily
VDTTTEWDLIRRCRQGSTAAFEPLVRAHEGPAHRTATALLGDPDDAADAVQEAFVRAYRSLRKLREGSAFGPWYRTILRNHCMDRLRSPRRRAMPWTERVVDPRSAVEPAAPAALEREALTRVVREALADLSPEHREILVMKEMEDLSYAEIARAAGIPAGTVASRLFHARAALAKALAARGMTAEEVA